MEVSVKKVMNSGDDKCIPDMKHKSKTSGLLALVTVFEKSGFRFVKKMWKEKSA